MRKLIYTVIIFGLSIIIPSMSSSQSLSINTDGSSANASALLDVKSTDKGVLIPRITRAQRDAISTPATGLLVFQVAPDSIGLYYYNGTGWAWVLANSNTDSLAWRTGGNTGTVDGTNFIGTKDNIPFNIRVNNQKAGRVDPTLKNTFLGYQAGNSNSTGLNNTAIGFQALQSNTGGGASTAIGYLALQSNTGGGGNTANGYQALRYNTLGGNNTANGAFALLSNTTGVNNTANGHSALLNDTTGSQNTANGYSALYLNSNGNNNTADGYQALFRNTTGSNNTATGREALNNNSTGTENTATGREALSSNSTGFNNTANGYFALLNNVTGFNNSAFGVQADVSSNALNNATAIGYSAVVNASNKIRLGNATVTVIEGQVAYTFPSDGRFKTDISERDVKGLDFIKRLRPVVYNFDTRKYEEFITKNMADSIRQKYLKDDFGPSTSVRQSGFIAQEVEKAALESGYNFNGVHKPGNENDHYSLAYSQFVVPLVKGMQEQQQLIETQQQMLINQQEQIIELKKQVEQILKRKKGTANTN